jgi:hypothetical protein
MAVYFPNNDVFRLALTSGAVPADVSQAPLSVAFVDGGLWVDTSLTLPKNAVAELRRLGAKFSEDGRPSEFHDFCCWPQLLPLESVDPIAGLTNQTPVLLELRPAALLAEVAGEMLRLGNDRQSFRWLTEGKGEGEAQAVFLRVIGPPYYTLLRAFERDGRGDAPRAYVERGPRVWVQIGHTHPLVEHLKPPAAQLLLLRPPRAWTVLPEAPFRDIYDILEFPLQTQPQRWRDTEPARRLTVPLRLVPANTAEPAEFWVLRDRGFEQVDDLVRTADDALVGRLAFAVAEEEGRTTVVLRVRPSRQEPPVLVLLGQSFRPFLKLPNLLVPCGTRLQPPLRRDAVRGLLADDPDRVTWLYPTGDGGFTPQSLPDSSFRPLGDWVDYVLHHEHVVLQQWIQATTFDFEPFICKDEERDAAAKGRKKEPKEKRARSVASPDESTPSAAAKLPPIKKGKKLGPEPDDLLPEVAADPPSELQKQLQELEQRFLSLEGPGNGPERQALWPELAKLNAALGHTSDAALCWQQALWVNPDKATTWAHTWSRGEVGDGNIAPILEKSEPTAADVRAVAAWLTATGYLAESSPPSRVGAAQHFLEKHEDLLSVRAVWLAAVGAFHLSHGDVLGLTRTRDRLLERLFQRGLTHDQDLPSFLRFSGVSHSDRMRVFRDWLLELPQHMARWVRKDNTVSDPDPRDTIAYGQLMLAFGLARLGEDRAAKHLTSLAEAWLAEQVDLDKDVHIVLKDAFRYRIQQALEGKPASGPLPTDLLEFAEQLAHLPRYKIDSLRMRSRILEPHEKINSIRNLYMGVLPEFDKALLALPDILDRARLERESQRLLAAAKNPLQRFNAIKALLTVAPGLGDAFAAPLVLEATAVCKDPIDEFEQAELLERALFMAAHFNQGEAIQGLLARFHALLRSDKVGADAKRWHALVGQCFRGLRKLGMQDEMRGLLQELTAVVTRGKPLAGLRKSAAWPKMVRRLLHVAAGHFYFDNESEGRPLLEEARLVLLHGDLKGREQTELACTYIGTLGQAPVGLALGAIDELLQRLQGVFDNFSSHTHYSASKLEVIEAIVMAVVTEEFAMGQVGRRWLEDDEYLVRKRIHRDVEATLQKP